MVKIFISKSAGNFQPCVRQEVGCEATVHAMQSLFHSSSTQAVFLADASSAFNTLNQRVSLHILTFVLSAPLLPLHLLMFTGRFPACSSMVNVFCLKNGLLRDTFWLWPCMRCPQFLS